MPPRGAARERLARRVLPNRGGPRLSSRGPRLPVPPSRATITGDAGGTGAARGEASSTDPPPHEGAHGDPEPDSLAGRRALRGGVHLRHGRREPAAPLLPGLRAEPRGHGRHAALRRRGSRAAPPRAVAAIRPPPDLLRARLVHRALPAGGRGDLGRRARAGPSRLHAREAQPALAGRRAGCPPEGARGHRQGLGPTPPRLPGAVVLVLEAHAGSPPRRGVPLRRLS